jgi:glucose/arabinose dehydrogenase
LAFYDGDTFPEWKNDFFAGGLQGTVHRLRMRDGKVIEDEVVFEGMGRVRDVRCGPDGFLYVVLNNPDRIVRLVPAGVESGGKK